MTIEWLAGNRIRGTTAERPALGLPSGSVGGWVELGRTTLGSDGDSIDVTGLADKRYLMALINVPTTGNARPRTRFNADTGNNYSDRWSHIGGGDTTTGTSQSFIYNEVTSTTDDTFAVCYASNLSNKEKLTICHGVSAKSAGASQEPFRSEVVGKWANTSDAISQWNLTNDLAGSYTSGSEVVVLGWDPDDTHTTNFWEELASVNATSGDNLSSGTILAKNYLWVQAWVKYTGAGGTLEETFNNDTGSNYSSRDSYNGGTDGLSTSASNIDWDRGVTDNYYFVNQFIINNSANEKLCIGHQNRIDVTGAGNAPIRSERVDKWANTSAQITEIDFDNSLGGIDISNAYLKVWGSN
jgi:hypothetical protein